MGNVKKQVLLCLASLMLAVLTVLTGIFPVGAVRCYAAEAESTENTAAARIGETPAYRPMPMPPNEA